MIIYEALDFTVGPVHRRGRDGLDRPRPADVHPRHGGDDQGEARAFRRGRHRARRHPGHQRRLHRPAATSTTSPSACRSSTRASCARFACCMAHWLDVGGMLGGITTDIYSEGLQIPIMKYQKRRRGQPGPGRHHPHERAHPGARDGRPARADHRGEDRRAALPRAARPLRARAGARRHRATSWTTRRRRRARARARIPGRRLRGRVVHGRRRRRHRQARPDQGARRSSRATR